MTVRDRPSVGKHRPPPKVQPEGSMKVRLARVDGSVSIEVSNPIEAKDRRGEIKPLTISEKPQEGQLTSDLQTQDILRDVLYELKHIRLHLESLTGENLRGDVRYADQ